MSLSWTRLARIAWAEIIEDDCLNVAAQLAYFLLLSLAPAMLMLLALAALLPWAEQPGELADLFQLWMPPEVSGLLTTMLSAIQQDGATGILTAGAARAVWSVSAALAATIDAVNRAYGIPAAGPWWRVRLAALGLTIILGLFTVASISLLAALSWAAGAAGLETLWSLLRWPLAFALVCLGLGIVYYGAPDAEQDWVWVTPGAIAGAALWILASLALRTYTASFANYRIYGAFGGIMVLLLWFYAVSFAILMGAELNAGIEQAARNGVAVRNSAGRRVLGPRAVRLLGYAKS